MAMRYHRTEITLQNKHNLKPSNLTDCSTTCTTSTTWNNHPPPDNKPRSRSQTYRKRKLRLRKLQQSLLEKVQFYQFAVGSLYTIHLHVFDERI